MDCGSHLGTLAAICPGTEAVVSTSTLSSEEGAAMPRNEGESNSFSFGDALFLYLEREVALRDCRAYIESKLPLVPRYRQRVVFPPFDLGLPSWEFDRRFDIRNHIQEVKLRHGTEWELKTLAGTIVSTRLDRRRPLWDFTLARLKGRRTGIV